EQLAGEHDVASVGRFNRQPRADSRLRAALATATRRCPRASRYRCRYLERGARRQGRRRRCHAANERTIHDLGSGNRRRRKRKRRLDDDCGSVRRAAVALMLLDTYGLVYRAFFALPALTTSKGTPINAAYGFTMMLNKIITDEKPTHVIAAFDKGTPAARL